MRGGGRFDQVRRIEVRLYGSLALTGRGHGTDRAILLGLEGETPEEVEPADMLRRAAEIAETGQLTLGAKRPIAFDVERDLLFLENERLPFHANGMRFAAWDARGETLIERTYYSVGGGFIVEQSSDGQPREESNVAVPFDFATAAELIETARRQRMAISEVVLENEITWRSERDIRSRLLNIWSVMQQCVRHGCETEGVLPGGLQLQRRAGRLYQELSSRPESALRDPLTVLDWVNMYALAVAEENAAGGRVVTAPTNGAAGIVPAVLHYYDRFYLMASEDGIIRFLLTAGAIGMLYKENASISGAEVGCQGEVGVACSMAAGALTEMLGGHVDQVEQAAEIGMEHNLGLTCDPMAGLVQVPCIERNAMGAVKAINAARLALRGDGTHKVPLDRIIEVMCRTGADMSDKYKETSQGGLAVNLPAC